MKKLMFLSVFIAVTSLCFSQTITKIWDKKINLNQSPQPKAIVIDSCGNTYVCCNDIGFHVKLIKFSPNGEEIWKWIDTLSAESYAGRRSLSYSLFDNSIVMQEAGKLLKFDTEGNLLWVVSSNGSSVSISDDTIATFGANGIVSFFASDGNLVRSFETGFVVNNYPCITLRDTSVWISAGDGNGENTNVGFYIAKFSQNGKFLWKWGMPDGIMSFSTVDKNGNSYCGITQYRQASPPIYDALAFRVVSLDPNGTVLWDKEWLEYPEGKANYSSWVHDIAVSGDSRKNRQVVVMGSTLKSEINGYSYNYARAFKAENGDSLWKLKGDYDASYKVSQYEAGAFTNDGYLIIAGDGYPMSLDATSYVQKFLSTTTGIKELPFEIPETFTLSQNYPNPFNPKTNIRFEIPSTMDVKLTVYSTLGEEIAVLINKRMNPGVYETDWDASGLTSGVYFYCLQTETFTETKKMLLIR